jgi:hypothetical protein
LSKLVSVFPGNCQMQLFCIFCKSNFICYWHDEVCD